MEPDCGRSSPAIERSVVVLPQPLGPSRVNSLPSGTSKATSRAARTTLPSSPGYWGLRPRTLSINYLIINHLSSFCIAHAKPAAGILRDLHQHEQQHDQHHSERGELDVLAVLPQLPDQDRDHLGARTVEQDRAGELTH